jgi:hypothetical protein
MVRYNGLSLELLRNAAFNEAAALEAVAAQNRIQMQGGPPRPDGPSQANINTETATMPSLAPASPTPNSPKMPDRLQSMACQVCSSLEGDETMLICDGCNLGYHMECLDPPLPAVPEDPLWFCSQCTSKGLNSRSVKNAPSPNLFEVAAILKKRQSIARNEPEYLVHWRVR